MLHHPSSHRLLGLKPKPDGDKLTFVRDRKAEPIDADVVVIDEANMLPADLMAHIRRHMTRAFVLFSGDKAQLPPVVEKESQAFGYAVPQRADADRAPGRGQPDHRDGACDPHEPGPDAELVLDERSADRRYRRFIPNGNTDAWMKRAFTSLEFEEDADKFRYVAWTNARVAEVNRHVRRWRYGDHIPTPFMPGERAMFRAPVIRDGDTLFGTNEEATVTSIEQSVFEYEFEAAPGADAWTASLPSWRVVLSRGDDDHTNVHMPQNDRDFERVCNRVKDEAIDCRDRWQHLHDFKAAMARMQSVYAMTVHTSQGSTHRFSFVNIPDIRKRERDKPQEMLQLLYTAATRPSHGLVLVGIG